MQKLALVILLASAARAQAPQPASTWAAPFAFEMPGDDGAPTFADASFLNTSPAGRGGRIIARGGHFVESNTNRRVRFVGINSTFDSSFPDHADAPRMAARLAKAGFNVVRFHYMDLSGYGRSSIWDKSKGDFRHLDAAQLDRLDFYIAELQKRGIYANLNLHVARKFSPADGFPDSVKSIPFDFDKRVDYFDPAMIARQKEYARALLTHRNPYTGRTYTDDPGVLCVEVTNEDSLRWSDGGSELLDLPEPFASTLRARWNGWLKTKYPSGAALRAAWSGEAAAGAEMLRAWAPETSGGAQMQIVPDATAGNGLRAVVSKEGGANWSAQVHGRGLSFVAGRAYTLSMRARSRTGRGLDVTAMLDRPDWRALGFSRRVQAGPEWKEFKWSFEAPETIEGQARLSIQLGDAVGEIELADVSLRAGAVGTVPAAEAFNASNVALPRDAFGAARRDWLEFLTDVEVGYADEMRAFLRRGLGVKSLVTVSQVDYGSLTGLYREGGSDYTDKHEYWDHPSTPNGWDITKLVFGNKSMVPEMGASGTLASASSWRVAGRPFVVSEYNHPFPNEFDAECVPLLALGASWQDWDAIYFHEWGFSPVNSKGGNVRISNPFTMWNAVSKMAFLPSMSILFRTSQLSPAPGTSTASVPVRRDGASLGRSIQSIWDEARHGQQIPVWSFQRRLGAPGAVVSTSRARLSTNHTVTWNDGKGGTPASLLVDAPSAQVLAGSLASRNWKSPRLNVSVGACPNSFAVISLSALDGKPLESSPRVLLSVASRIQNRGMKMREDRRNLPDWGSGPVEVEVPNLQIEMKTDGPRRVQVLDGTGKPVRAVASSWANGTLRFSTSGADRSVWYGISVR